MCLEFSKKWSLFDKTGRWKWKTSQQHFIYFFSDWIGLCLEKIVAILWPWRIHAVRVSRVKFLPLEWSSSDGLSFTEESLVQIRDLMPSESSHAGYFSVGLRLFVWGVFQFWILLSLCKLSPILTIISFSIGSVRARFSHLYLRTLTHIWHIEFLIIWSFGLESKCCRWVLESHGSSQFWPGGILKSWQQLQQGNNFWGMSGVKKTSVTLLFSFLLTVNLHHFQAAVAVALGSKQRIRYNQGHFLSPRMIKLPCAT